ncbi:hypothetical protein FOMPIDRAFT_1014896 [Fomitopsis schrenkii]|uniref:Rax2-like third domain-containing protein n=1 Tax=Fomitopsis schrenkii TaxID=2126942 RepID=S8EJ24_FOMSC|nr:hypothetical protein FOMPIDRAFT_1014896 [Fomitopsis schrenkii]
MQLLSSGAYASAVSSNNTQSCFAPGPSTVTFTGNWNEKQATTNVQGTLRTVLVSDVAVGTSASSGPSVTWMPYVSALGTYDVYMVVPGCSNFQDCPLHTSVAVTVFLGGGLQLSVTTIPQTNANDQSTLIYSGPVVPSSPNFQMTIESTALRRVVGSTGMVLVQNGADGQPELSPLGIQLAGNVSATGSTSSLSRVDVFKHMFNERAASDAATLPPLPPAPASPAPAVFAGAFWVNSSAKNEMIVIGGNFTYTSGGSTCANIAIYDNSSDTLTPLRGNQVNGTVRTLLVQGEKLFIGGEFMLQGTNANGFALVEGTPSGGRAVQLACALRVLQLTSGGVTFWYEDPLEVDLCGESHAHCTRQSAAVPAYSQARMGTCHTSTSAQHANTPDERTGVRKVKARIPMLPKASSTLAKVSRKTRVRKRVASADNERTAGGCTRSWDNGQARGILNGRVGKREDG